MKINNLINPQPGSSVKGSASRPASDQSAATKTSAAPQDSVQLSTLSATAEAASSPPVDIARVDAIKQAISEGRFKINHEAIADGLIATARGLMTEHSA